MGLFDTEVEAARCVLSYLILTLLLDYSTSGIYTCERINVAMLFLLGFKVSGTYVGHMTKLQLNATAKML